MIDTGCETCRHYAGDCGHHHTDFNGHVVYAIPSESACDRFGDCNFYEESRTPEQIAIKELMESNISAASKDILQRAIVQAIIQRRAHPNDE